MYYVLQIRHKEDKQPSDYPKMKKYLMDCDVIDHIYNTEDMNVAIDVYLKYIEPDWTPGFYSQRESVEYKMKDSFTDAIDYRRIIKGIPKEYILIDGEQHEDIMQSFKSVLRNVKLNQILNEKV